MAMRHWRAVAAVAILAACPAVSAQSAGPDTQPAGKKLNPDLVHLPANTWVHIKPNRNPEGRSFSGVCWGNGLIYYFGGGHRSYVGNDVELYDVAANTWTQATECEDWREHPKWTHLTEEQQKLIKCIGGGSNAPLGILTPKGRPPTYHSYQQHAWFPEERAFYNLGQKWGMWAFEPASRQWREVTRQLPRYGDQSNVALTYDPGLKTVVAMTATASREPGAYAFDRDIKGWVKKCAFPAGANGDIFTACDPGRNVHVVATRGLWFTADLAAGTTKPMKHFGEAVVAAGKPRPWPDASVAFDPDSKLTLAITNAAGKGQGSPIELWAHDADKDEWTEVKMDGAAPKGDIRWNLMVYDPDHRCCLLLNVLGVQGSKLQGGPVNGLFAFRLRR